jgi:hypothetical protein
LNGRAVAYQTRVDGAEASRRPWVARLWAAARVDDLVNEITLGGARPELQAEVIDLALAYNLSSPYTAFLAIPASELDEASAHTLATARQYKSDLLRRRPDAAGVAGEQTAVATEGREMSRRSGPSAHRQRAVEVAGLDAEDVAMADDVEQETAAPRRARQHRAENMSGSRRQSGGCASCQLAGSEEGGLASLLLAWVLLLGRRRRRTG